MAAARSSPAASSISMLSSSAPSSSCVWVSRTGAADLNRRALPCGARRRPLCLRSIPACQWVPMDAVTDQPGNRQPPLHLLIRLHVVVQRAQCRRLANALHDVLCDQAGRRQQLFETSRPGVGTPHLQYASTFAQLSFLPSATDTNRQRMPSASCNQLLNATDAPTLSASMPLSDSSFSSSARSCRPGLRAQALASAQAPPRFSWLPHASRVSRAVRPTRA